MAESERGLHQSSVDVLRTSPGSQPVQSPAGGDANLYAELSILVVSCDRYGDLWKPFFVFQRKFWPDCPYRIFVGSNHTPCLESGVTSLTIGDDRNWSDGLMRMLGSIPTEFVLTIQEDFLLWKRVRNEEVEHCLRFLLSTGGFSIKLKPAPRPNVSIPGEPLIGILQPGAPYRVSNQATIWRKSALQSLLVSGESPWTMESKGTARSEAIEKGFYSVWRPVLQYEGHGAISRGKWERKWVRRCRELGVSPDLSSRKVMSLLESFRWSVGKAGFSVIGLVPWRVRARLLRHLSLRHSD
jgi:hypothetical protein